MNEKYMQALRLKRDVQGTIMTNYDKTPVRRGMIDITLRLKQDREGNKNDIIWTALRLKMEGINKNLTR